MGRQINQVQASRDKLEQHTSVSSAARLSLLDLRHRERHASSLPAVVRQQ